MPISFDLTPEQEALRRKVKEFCEKEILPKSAEIDEKEGIPRELVEKILKPPNSFPAIWIPRKYGGLELDEISICVLVEEIGHASGSCIPFIEVAGLGFTSVMIGGKEEVKEKYLKAGAKGEAFPAVAMTEPEVGSDAGAIKLRAEKVGDEYVLNGVKRQISQIDVASFLVVSARTDPDPAKGPRGVSVFVVDKESPGLTIGPREPYIGVRGHKAYQLEFEGVRVPAINLLGEENKGFKVLMQALDRTRLSLAAGTLGIARASLEAAINYCKKRTAFGKPLWEHEAIGFSIAEMATEIEAARLLVYKAAWLHGKGVRHTKETSMAKWYACEAAVRAAYRAMVVLGGYGVMKLYPVERYFRDAMGFRFGQGSTEIQKLIISRELMRGS